MRKRIEGSNPSPSATREGTLRVPSSRGRTCPRFEVVRPARAAHRAALPAGGCAAFVGVEVRHGFGVQIPLPPRNGKAPRGAVLALHEMSPVHGARRTPRWCRRTLLARCDTATVLGAVATRLWGAHPSPPCVGGHVPGWRGCNRPGRHLGRRCSREGGSAPTSRLGTAPRLDLRWKRCEAHSLRSMKRGVLLPQP
jgi:hypothetical protein